MYIRSLIEDPLSISTVDRLIAATVFEFVDGCREGNKHVGVCLHVYLERDFLSLENIVYPRGVR